jgi:hypothetical protein
VSEVSDLQAALESAAADRAERQLKIKRGELVSVTALKPLVVARAIAVRELLFVHGPVRHAARLAVAHGDLDAALVYAALSALMRRTLTSISKNGPPALRAAKANGQTT